MKRWKILILIIFLMFPMTVHATQNQNATQYKQRIQMGKETQETSEETEAVSQE